MVAALHKDGESITKLEKADVLGKKKGVTVVTTIS